MYSVQQQQSEYVPTLSMQLAEGQFSGMVQQQPRFSQSQQYPPSSQQYYANQLRQQLTLQLPSWQFTEGSQGMYKASLFSVLR